MQQKEVDAEQNEVEVQQNQSEVQEKHVLIGVDKKRLEKLNVCVGNHGNKHYFVEKKCEKLVVCVYSEKKKRMGYV